MRRPQTGWRPKKKPSVLRKKNAERKRVFAQAIDQIDVLVVRAMDDGRKEARILILERGECNPTNGISPAPREMFHGEALHLFDGCVELGLEPYLEATNDDGETHFGVKPKQD